MATWTDCLASDRSMNPGGEDVPGGQLGIPGAAWWEACDTGTLGAWFTWPGWGL